MLYFAVAEAQERPLSTSLSALYFSMIEFQVIEFNNNNSTFLFSTFYFLQRNSFVKLVILFCVLSFY